MDDPLLYNIVCELTPGIKVCVMKCKMSPDKIHNIFIHFIFQSIVFSSTITTFRNNRQMQTRTHRKTLYTYTNSRTHIPSETCEFKHLCTISQYSDEISFWNLCLFYYLKFKKNNENVNFLLF